MEIMEGNTLDLLEFRELEGHRGPEALNDTMEQLATYLLEGDLCHAKFLWKRTPVELKKDPELAAIWSAGQALWTRDMPEFYMRAKTYEWSPRIKPVMSRLVVSVQEKMVRLIGTAYTSIQRNDVANLLGISSADVDNIVIEKGWTITEGGMIEPKEPPPQEVNLASAELQIEKLTDFVSFLEN